MEIPPLRLSTLVTACPPVMEQQTKMSNSDTEAEVEEGGEEYYSSQTVVNLRQLCKERGLKVGGKKQEIIDRLIDYDDEMNNNEEEEDNEEAEDTSAAAAEVSEDDADNNNNLKV